MLVRPNHLHAILLGVNLVEEGLLWGVSTTSLAAITTPAADVGSPPRSKLLEAAAQVVSIGWGSGSV